MYINTNKMTGDQLFIVLCDQDDVEHTITTNISGQQVIRIPVDVTHEYYGYFELTFMLRDMNKTIYEKEFLIFDEQLETNRGTLTLQGKTDVWLPINQGQYIISMDCFNIAVRYQLKMDDPDDHICQIITTIEYIGLNFGQKRRKIDDTCGKDCFYLFRHELVDDDLKVLDLGRYIYKVFDDSILNRIDVIQIMPEENGKYYAFYEITNIDRDEKIHYDNFCQIITSTQSSIMGNVYPGGDTDYHVWNDYYRQKYTDFWHTPRIGSYSYIIRYGEDTFYSLSAIKQVTKELYSLLIQADETK